MDKLTSLRVLCHVVEEGSFSAAARALKISPAMVTKHIASLEQQLNTRLLNRTTRRVNATEAGERYYQKCRRILQDLNEAEASISELGGAPSGLLRISAPMDFGLMYLAPAIGCYLARYPEVSIDIDYTDSLVNLLDQRFDLAIRISQLADSSLVAQRIMSSRHVLCAAPAYLERHGEPACPDELSQHNCLTYSYSTTNSEWTLVKEGRSHSVRFAGRLNANNGRAMVLAAVQGLGIICKPEFLVRDFLQSGALVPILTEYSLAPGNELHVYAVYPHRQYLPAKVRTFIEFLKERLAEQAEGQALNQPR